MAPIFLHAIHNSAALCGIEVNQVNRMYRPILFYTIEGQSIKPFK